MPFFMMLNNSINVTNFAYLRHRFYKPNIFISSFGYIGKASANTVIYVNGPIKALGALFETMGSVINSSSIELSKKNHGHKQISNTFRHIPNKIQNKEFHLKKYRYFTNLEHLDISNPIKNQIINDSIEL
jgi:hypothetical protein